MLHSFGDDGGGVPRVPISNTTVKPSSADGTWTAGFWESRTLPSETHGSFRRKLRKLLGGFLFWEISRKCIIYGPLAQLVRAHP